MMRLRCRRGAVGGKEGLVGGGEGTDVLDDDEDDDEEEAMGEEETKILICYPCLRTFLGPSLGSRV
jgi:hypothetical protein